MYVGWSEMYNRDLCLVAFDQLFIWGGGAERNVQHLCLGARYFEYFYAIVSIREYLPMLDTKQEYVLKFFVVRSFCSLVRFDNYNW